MTPQDPGPPGPGPLPPFKAWRPGLPPDRPVLLRFLLAALGAAALVALVLVIAVLIARRPRPAPPEPAPPPAPEWTTTATTVRPGEVMPRVLARAGVPDTLAARVVAALGAAGFDFRRMRPGDSLSFLSAGPRARLLYRQDFERVWRVDIGPPDRVGTLLRQVERVPGVVSGAINSSLWDALVRLGEEPALVLDYAEVLGWEVDFFTESQVGDSFYIYVTRRLCDSTLVGYEPVVGVRYSGAVGDFAGFRFTDPEGRTDYYNPAGECMRKTFLKSPLSFARVTSFFGRRFHPIIRTWRQHHGVDYAAPTGTPASSVAEGRVVFAGWKGGYGRCVEVSHPGGYLSRYGHLSGFGRGVRVGASVSQGQVVGYVGSTGLSTGPHLHFEIHKFGTPVNPLRLDPPRVEPVKPEFLAGFEAVRDSICALAPALRPRR
ncbi:MAG: M23 family metallopeptidase [bacterium]